MTTFEHAMVGVCGVLALGLNRRFGWRLPALAGVAAVTPDWDGLTLLFSAQRFEQGHRVWGHNLLVCAITGLVLGLVDAKWDLMGRARRVLLRILRQPATEPEVSQRLCSFSLWSVVAILAALSHLPADLVFSGGHGLADWELQLCWPFSSRGFVYPMVRWGDVGATLVFVAGLFAMLRWKNRLQWIATGTLLGVVLYIVARGSMIEGD
jgi:hypothetical protein